MTDPTNTDARWWAEEAADLYEQSRDPANGHRHKNESVGEQRGRVASLRERSRDHALIALALGVTEKQGE